MGASKKIRLCCRDHICFEALIAKEHGIVFIRGTSEDLVMKDGKFGLKLTRAQVELIYNELTS